MAALLSTSGPLKGAGRFELMAAKPFTENVIPHLLAWRQKGIASALVTLVGVEGSSPRQTGSQMAVAANGDYHGYISSGCAEAAIVGEAMVAIERGTNRTVRYGAGSKFIDIVLPCGSGIDVHFDATISTEVIAELDAEIAARQPMALVMDIACERAARLSKDATRASQEFRRSYKPRPRVVVAGRGVHVDYVARFAHELEWDVVVASPDEATLARLAAVARQTQHLTRPDDFDTSVIDPYSAVVLVFHDHEWEPAILAKCAAAPAFYVGALGSRRTHAERKKLLAILGCDRGFIDGIRSPIGLDIAAKNPAEIALAIVAEILAAVRAG